jgi:uncharacterized protein (TIGR00269 family)
MLLGLGLTMNNLSTEKDCTQCKKPAIITRYYSGEVLCENCFRDSIMTKVRKAISKWKMLERTDRIAVAISGGKDSAVLLSVLVNNQQRFPDSEIIAITLDEGKAEDKERKTIVSTLAQQFGVELIFSSYEELFSVNLDDVVNRASKAKSPLAPCAFCGVMRRQGLNILARRLNADKLALGHNLDDEVQSMIMNLIRGDLRRLSRITPFQKGLSPQLVSRIKPLYHILEEDLQLYAELLQLPTQQNPCSYRTQSLRSEIRYWLNEFEKRHAGTKYNLFATLSRIITFLQQQTETDFQNCQICGEPTSRAICAPCELLGQLKLRSENN